MYEDDKDELKRLIDSHLLSWDIKKPLSNFWSELSSKAGDKYDPKIAAEYLWDLARLGIIVPLGIAHVGVLAGDEPPSLFLTERGQAILEKREESPHNEDAYIFGIRKRIAEVDEIALSYLKEAVRACKAGLYRSSMVMLGCSCERIAILLAECIAGTPSLSDSASIVSCLNSKYYSLNKLIDKIRNVLNKHKGECREFKEGCGDSFDRQFSSLVDHIRVMRNESGHPTGRNITFEDAWSGLFIFPNLYEFVDKIISHLKNKNEKKKEVV